LKTFDQEHRAVADEQNVPESKIAEVLRSLQTDRMVTNGLSIFNKFCECGRPAQFLCDWKVAAHKTGTCDNPICEHHAKEVGLCKRLCPEHQLEYDRWKARRKFTASQQRNLFEEAA
jgi:hypothetical protein